MRFDKTGFGLIEELHARFHSFRALGWTDCMSARLGRVYYTRNCSVRHSVVCIAPSSPHVTVACRLTSLLRILCIGFRNCNTILGVPMIIVVEYPKTLLLILKAPTVSRQILVSIPECSWTCKPRCRMPPQLQCPIELQNRQPEAQMHFRN